MKLQSKRRIALLEASRRVRQIDFAKSWANGRIDGGRSKKMESKSRMICFEVVYSGRVQGVGFRWTTARIARRHSVSGHVQNLPNGTVSLLAQGSIEAVRAYLDDVAEAMAANIETAEETETACQEDLAGFKILR